MLENISERIQTALKNISGKGHLTEANIKDALREVRMAMLEADVALPVAKAFVEQVRERAIGQEVIGSLTPDQALLRVVRDELTALMGNQCDELNLNARPPVVVLMAGLQGSGKTTSTGKLARRLLEQNKKKVLTVSCDVYRPAAIEQLKTVSAEVGAEWFPSTADQKPVDIAKAALAHAQTNQLDVVLVDTAGRLHIDAEMMAEIQGIHRAIQPQETLFVVDGMTGQDAANTAKTFNEALPLTGVILTKMDGDARGGAALSVRHVTGKPIKFLGVGEKSTALEPFHPDRIASRIIGQGDVLSLIEEAERKIDKEKAEQLADKFRTGQNFDLEDFREQLYQMQNIGGIGSMLDKLPGAGSIPKEALAQVNDDKVKYMVAIINSMTPHERRFPAVIKGSRKKRIAAGSGTQLQDINRLLKQFTQMQKAMKQIRKKGGMANMMRNMKNKLPPGMMPF